MKKGKQENTILKEPKEDLVYFWPEDIDKSDCYNNEKSCLYPTRYVDKKCNNCDYEVKCLYYMKYKYRKIQ